MRHGGGRIEIGRLMPVRSISKAQLTPSCLQFTTISKPSPPPYTHFPTRDTTNTLLIILSLQKSRMDDSWQVFFDHNAWPGHSAGLEKSCHFACHSQVLTLHEFRLLFPHRSSGFRSFNGTRNLMNERLQIFRFDHGGNATERLQCRNLLTPNLLWLFQAWCH